MLAQSPKPEAHDKVLDNSPDRIGIWKCKFLRRGENRSTPRKTSRSREENQQQTQPTYDTVSGSRTRGTLVRGERSHQCAIPAPQMLNWHLANWLSGETTWVTPRDIYYWSSPYAWLVKYCIRFQFYILLVRILFCPIRLCMKKNIKHKTTFISV